jgi:hypothetical protein
MYPAQTSLIPTQIALARFLDQGGDPFGFYPFWYLGTTPYRFLTGPVLPFILTFVHRLMPLNLFTLFFLLVGISWLLGAAGFYGLVRQLKGNRRVALLAAFFYLFGPIVFFLFPFSNGLYLIAFSFLPFVFLFYSWLLKEWNPKSAIILALLITFEILLDSLIIPTLILGLAAIFLAQVGWKKAEEKAKKSLLIIFVAILVATFWYTPFYWLTLLTAGSLAGKGLAEVIISLGKLLPTALAFGVAVFSIKFFKKRKLLRDFCFYWLFIFGCLTLLRFLSDPDFWLDWTAWALELQFGLALGLDLVFSSFLAKKSWAKIGIFCFLGLYLVFAAFVFEKFVLKTFQFEIKKTEEYQIGQQLEQIIKPRERVFLSGTTAFWLNSFFDIPQVRGGVDQAAVDRRWQVAVWEVREGTDPEKSHRLLKDLRINYLVVHTQRSEEHYHDFSQSEKFEDYQGFEKIFDQRGDRIYKIEELSTEKENK